KLRQVRSESLKGKRQECKGKVENEKLQRRVEGVLVHIDHGTIPVELNRHDVEPAGTISEAVTRQVVSRERHHPAPLERRNRFGCCTELEPAARLDFDEDRRLAVARDDVEFATPPAIPAGNNCVPAPFELAAR